MTIIFNHLTIAQAYECLKNFNHNLPDILSSEYFIREIKKDPILKDCFIYINKISYISSKYVDFQKFENLPFSTFINIYTRITDILLQWEIEIEYVHDLPEFKFTGL